MSTLLTEVLPPSPDGMVTARAGQELQDTEAQYIQDGLVDLPGFIRRRGPVEAVSGLATLPRKGTGLVMALDPNGVDRYAVLTGDNANGYLTAFSQPLDAVTDLAWPHPLPTSPDVGTSTAYRIVDAKAALNGGLWLGVSSEYDSNSPNQGLALWGGSAKGNYTAGTLTVARGSASVVGVGTTWVNNVEAGMHLFANTDEGYSSTLVGVVKTVVDNTHITLQAVSPYAITAKAYTLQSLRGFAPKVAKGRITCDTTTATVSGGGTKFRSQLATGTWQLYRQSDMAYIGKLLSVQSDIALTLTGNAAIAMADELYIAIRADADYSIPTTSSTQKVGFLSANYAERQWFANNGGQFEKTYRVWFSDPADPEAVDLTEDGDWIGVASTGLIQEAARALAPAYNALVVVKETETFGIFGSSPSTFAVKKLADDGTLSGMSVQLFGGGVIWAGREGIWFFDGINVNNLTAAKLGDVWRNAVKGFDPERYRMWSMVARDHYFLHVEQVTPTVGPVKGNTSTEPTRWTIAISMLSGAITLHTNVNIRGAIKLPAGSGQRVWYLVNDGTRAQIAPADSLFDKEGNDSVLPDGATSGPDFYWETKKFDAGDPLRLKKFKRLAVHYLAAGDAMDVDVVLGLNEVGTRISTQFPATVPTWTSLKNAVPTWTGAKTQYASWSDVVESVFKPKRARYQKASTHLAFRFYQNSSSVTRLKLGPFHIGYKLARIGRVS